MLAINRNLSLPPVGIGVIVIIPAQRP